MKWRVWGLLTVLVVLVFAGLWWRAQSLRGEPYIAWEGWRGEAKYEDFYLAQRLLQATGATVKRTKILSKQIPQNVDTVVFEYPLIEEQLAEYLPWIEQGGTILARTTLRITDKLSWQKIEQEKETASQTPSENGDNAETTSQDVVGHWRDVQGQALQARWRFWHCYHFSGKADLLADDRGCVVMAVIPMGRGRLVSVTSMMMDAWKSVGPFYGERWTPDSRLPIQEADNAKVWLDVLHQSKQVLWVKTVPHKEPTLSFSVKWWPLWGCLGLLLLSILWRFGVRFGGARSLPKTPNRFGWQRHFQATGYYLLQEKQYSRMRDVALVQLQRESGWRLSAQKLAHLRSLSVASPADFMQTMAEIAKVQKTY